MAAADLDPYFLYEARLNSFQKSTKKRASTTAGARAAKTLNWPHKQISPASLARAGFFFRPSPASPDNTVCFLCEKGLDGWEAGDDPLVEHLKHAPHCGWAVVAAIEAEVGDYGKEDPNKPEMAEARKATFAGKWPHDGKKGWKCKTKQLVEAGWKYTPVMDSDDMATCTYCQLALDGWEPNDKPFDEHYNRSPKCPFFALTNQYKTMGKNSGRGKAARTSKASRLSGQSVGTVASETAAVTDMTAGPEDSVLTTASTTTQAAKKPRAKKGTTAKGSKKKVKKEEPAEVPEDSHQVEEESLPQPPPKAKRSRKRPSDETEESTMSTSEGPASKKRATRAPASDGANSSIVAPEDSTEIADSPAPKATGRKKASNPKSDRKAPAVLDSNASMASLRAPPGSFPDDDEIERQLEADLERLSSDDEEIAQDSDSERLKARAKTGVAETAPEVEQAPPVEERSAHYAMFDPAAPELDESAIDEELKALQAEMEVDEPEQQIHVPKKNHKVGTGKASKQTTKAKKPKVESPPQNETEPAIPEPQTDEDIEEDVSMASTGTVVKKTVPAPTAAEKRGRGRPSKASLASQGAVEILEAAESAQPLSKRGRGRPSKASLASRVSDEAEGIKPAEAPTKRGRGRPSKASLASQDLNPTEDSDAAPAPVKRGRGRPSKASLPSQDVNSLDSVNDTKDAEAPVKRNRGRPSKKSIDIQPMEQMEMDVEEGMIEVHQSSEEDQDEPAKSPAPPVSASQSLRLPPSTPTKVISPAPSARQPVLSPSQSPQASDAENQPPSALPPAPATIKRVVLAPVTATPMRGSPSKRNVIAGLRSANPWTSTNLEAIFGTPRSSPCKDKEADRFLKRGKELTSPEKRMSVEEWIHFNATEAEKKLKHECETLVSQFESEGTRALQVLEGLEVE